nr:hypothetical protein [Streptomyces sp. SID5470]
MSAQSSLPVVRHQPPGADPFIDRKSTGRPDVLVDLRGVEFFDCSGLRVVTDGPRLHRLLRASGLWQQ